MLIAPLKRFLTLTYLNPISFSSSTKPTKLFQSLISCPEAGLQKYLREMSKLDDDNMKVCIDILIARMQASEVKHSLLINQLYQTYMRRFPLYQFHSLLQQVGVKLAELMRFTERGQNKDEKVKIVEINNIYANAFDLLRRLKKQQIQKEEPYLLYSFALYHSNILSQMVKDEQVEPTLKKAVEILQKLMSKCIIILDNKEREYGKDYSYSPQEIRQFRALDKLLQNKKTIPTVERSAIEDHFNTLYYVRRVYTNMYTKAVTALFDITNRLTHPKSNARKEPPDTIIHPGLFEMVPALQLALQLYRRIGDERGLQIHYFPIRRQIIQLLYEQNLTKIHLYQIPQMKQQYFQLLQDLKQQIIYTLSALDYEDQDTMTFFSTYEVLYRVHVVTKERILRQQNPLFSDENFKELLELTFHELMSSVSNEKIKDMLGIHLLDFIAAQYGVDFLKEFEETREKREQLPKKQQQQQTPRTEKPIEKRQQIQLQMKKTRLRSTKPRKNPVKPLDLQ